MTILRKANVVTVLAVLIALGAAGCGGSSMTFTPDFAHPELRSAGLKRDNVRIVKVNDARPHASNNIGTARVGMFNQEVPYVMNGAVAEVVKTMLDTLLVGKHDQERFIPLTVSLNMFEVGEKTKGFGEEGWFACNLTFQYPASADSIGRQAVFVTQTDHSAVDVTNSIEPLIYKGMVECARQFAQGTLDKNPNLLTVSRDSVEVVHARDSVRVAARVPTRSLRSSQVVVPPSNSVKTNELAFHYSQGDKITTGIRGKYNMLTEAEGSRLPWGLGIGLTYYDIENKQDLVHGTFVSFGASIMVRYYFSENPTSPYIAGDLMLVGGSERNGTAGAEETTFFFGPTVEEVLGLSLNRRVSLEAGSFQLAHFGSTLLPSDVGFTVGISFAF